MLGRLVLIGVLASAMPASAKQGLGIHISQPMSIDSALPSGVLRAPATPRLAIHIATTAAVTQDPGHRRTLRDAIAQALSAHSGAVPAGYVIDVALLRFDAATPRSGELEITIEVQASLSDEKGRMRWSSTARTNARGPARDRGLLLRDAFGDASRQLVKRLATRERE